MIRPLDGRRHYMTVQEVAEHLNISRSSVYAEISCRKLMAKKFGKKAVRVHVEEVKRYEIENDWNPT